MSADGPVAICNPCICFIRNAYCKQAGPVIPALHAFDLAPNSNTLVPAIDLKACLQVQELPSSPLCPHTQPVQDWGQAEGSRRQGQEVPGIFGYRA